jgi:hypothetical protein
MFDTCVVDDQQVFVVDMYVVDDQTLRMFVCCLFGVCLRVMAPEMPSICCLESKYLMIK